MKLLGGELADSLGDIATAATTGSVCFSRLARCDDVIVCRCEEVRRGALALAAVEGCPGPNQLKSFTRAGMGPCQGRLCGLTVTETMAELRGATPAQTGYYRLRMPIKPVTVGDIAGLTTNRGDTDDA